MRVVSWNCNGALRKKTIPLEELEPDILIVQECEDPSRSTKEFKLWAGDYLWVGENKNKGLGVFARKGTKICPLNWNKFYHLSLATRSHAISWSTKELKLFLPFRAGNLTVIAVWTKGHRQQDFRYIGQFWKFLQIHKADMSYVDVMAIGDFNSNKNFDRTDNWWSHSDVVRELKEIGVCSVYHLINNEEQGEETIPTFYMNKNEGRPYHIDFAFCSENIVKKASLIIGDRHDWIHYSDHMPLILDI